MPGHMRKGDLGQRPSSRGEAYTFGHVGSKDVLRSVDDDPEPLVGSWQALAGVGLIAIGAYAAWRGFTKQPLPGTNPEELRHLRWRWYMVGAVLIAAGVVLLARLA